MKFFHINNSHCTECGSCTVDCPTGAIFNESGKRFINYDRCTGCGNCVRTCPEGAVNIDTVANLVAMAEKSESYRQNLVRVQNELAETKTKLSILDGLLSGTIGSLSNPACVFDQGGLLHYANDPFTRTANLDGGTAVRKINIKHILPENILRDYVFRGREDHIRAIPLKINDFIGSVSFYFLEEGFCLCLFNDPAGCGTLAPELTALLRDTIERKMDMVSKIGSLLGEEASAEIDDLNRAIKLIELPSGEDE